MIAAIYRAQIRVEFKEALRTTRERDATRSPTAMRGNCSSEDEPGYRQLLHGSSSPSRV
jgi:hypothetical protein